MTNKLNPYQDHEILEIEIFKIDEDSGYDFKIMIFIYKNNMVFVANDSGCSCMYPFEYYEGNSWEDIEPLLERVGTVSQGLQSLDSWRNNYKCTIEDRMNVEKWLGARL